NPAVFLSNDMTAIRGAVLKAVQSTSGYPGLTGTITIHGGDNAAVTALPVYAITSKQPRQWTFYPNGS
ncbi:MAG TPA: hypothetical protein VFA10_01650, partial [Ktedonobacteraceae bacterium]|nr:hypothetical protein [Ktedonobacteraceae bacterium]